MHYNELQLQPKDISDFLGAREGYRDLRSRYDLPYDVDTVWKMVRDLHIEHRLETKEEIKRLRQEHFDGRIGVLKHHYKFPSRWKDSVNGSYLFGHPSNITEEMFVAMEKIYPDYREHIKQQVTGKIDHSY
jgi:hypothetical protein